MAGFPIPPENGGTGEENTNKIKVTGGDIELNLPGNLSVDLPLTLPKVYANGDTEINIVDINPIMINTLGATKNSIAVPTSPSSTASNSVDRIEGFGFIPATDIYVDAVQYRAANFTAGGTRTVQIYRESDQVLMGDGVVATTDPLDPTSIWYTKALASLIKLDAGIQYGISVVVPGGEAYDSFATATPQAGININQVWDGPDTSTPQFPNTVITQANQPMSGAFTFRVYDSGVKISNDGEVLEITKDGVTGSALMQKDSGSATLVAGTVVISSTSAAAGDYIDTSCLTPGGVQGFISYSINPGVSITLTSSSALDTSTYNWKNLGA